MKQSRQDIYKKREMKRKIEKDLSGPGFVTPPKYLKKVLPWGKAALENDPDYKSVLRKNGNLLFRKALHLHMIAGISEGPCGFEEISIFERFVDLQIAVVTTSNMQKVIIF